MATKVKLIDNTISPTLAGASFTGDVNFEGGQVQYDASSNSLDLQDSIYLQLGTDNDLRIYHDGSHARLRETTGDFRIQTTSSGVNALVAKQNAAVEIYHAGAKKLETSSTGATVTGNLTVTGDLDITGNVNSASVTDLDVEDKTITLGVGQTEAQSGSSGIIIDGSNASLLWDETNDEFVFNKNLKSGSLQLTADTTSYTENANISYYSSSNAVYVNGAGNDGWLRLNASGTANDRTAINLFGVNQGDLITMKTNSSERIRIDSSGRVGIGTSAPSNYHAKGDNLVIATPGVGDTGMTIVSSSSLTGRIFFADGTSGGAESMGQIKYDHGSNFMSLHTSDNERLRIDSSGNVGIGTSSPTKKLDVRGGSAGGTHSHAVFTGTTGRGLEIRSRSDTAGGQHNGTAELNAQDTEGNGGQLAFSTGGTIRAFLNHNGLGIGTTDPAKLGLTGSSTGKVLHLHGDDSQLRLTNGILHHDNSGNTIFHLRNHYGATSALAQMRFESGYHSWYTGTSFDEKMRLQNNTLYVSTDIGAHSNVTSFAHSTYAHAAVFGCNSTPNGTVVIEDYDVSSGIGNTVLRLYLRDQDPATSATFVAFADGGGRVGSVSHNDDGGGVTYNTTSDYRLKENVDYDWDATTLLKQLKPCKFNFKKAPGKTVQGMLAHEVMDIVPHSVRGDKDHMEPIGNVLDSDGNIVHEGVYEHFAKADDGQTWTKTGEEPLYQELDYSRLVPLLVKTIQELEARIETLEG